MSNEYIYLLDIPRLIKRPFRLRDMGWHVNHLVYSRQRLLTVPHFCFTRRFDPGISRSLVNGELHERSSIQPYIGILPPGTILHTLCGRKHDELYFTIPVEDFDFIMNTFKPLAGEFIMNHHIENLFNEISVTMEEIYVPGAADRMDGLFLRLLEETTLAIATPGNSSARDSEIYEIISYINSNFNKEMTLEQICRKYSISLRTLYRKWSLCFSHTPAEFILKKRLDYAEKLLLTTDLPVKTIALNSGFNSPLYFSKCFQRAYRQSPGQYRKNSLGKNMPK